MTEKFFGVDFEIEKEVWNRYKLVENAEFRGRVVLLKLFKSPVQESKDLGLGGDTQILVSIIPYPNYSLFGKPIPKLYSPQEIDQAKKVDVEFSQIAEDWNVYKLSNGTKIKIKLVLASIKRCLELYDKDGIPIYTLDSSIVIHKDELEKTK